MVFLCEVEYWGAVFAKVVVMPVCLAVLRTYIVCAHSDPGINLREIPVDP